MKRLRLFLCAAFILATGNNLSLRAADEAAPPIKPQIPPELREQLKNLPPAERDAKLKEWRDKQRTEGEKRREELKNVPLQEREARLKELQERRSERMTNRAEFEKRREEFRNLSPEERQKKIQELQEQRRAERPEFKGITTQEREAKRKEMRSRLDKQLADLRKKKTDGTITDPEQRRLQHMEEIAKRFDQDESRPVPPPPHPDLP